MTDKPGEPRVTEAKYKKIMVKKIIDEYKDDLETLKLLKKYAEDKIISYELTNKSTRLNKLLNTNCYAIMEDYLFEDLQNNSTKQIIKINNTASWSGLTIEKMYNHDKIQCMILNCIKVQVDGITIIDSYNPSTHKYIFTNTNTNSNSNSNTITLEENNFASKEDLIKILEIFE